MEPLGHARARVRHDRGRRAERRPQVGVTAIRRGVVPVRAAVAALRRRPAQARSLAGLRRDPRVLRVGQRGQGQRGQDLPWPAIAAGLASPWGQSVPAGNFTNGEPTYFGSYREEFSRDMYEAFTGLLVAGDVQTAQAATKFRFHRQQLPNGSMPRNSLPNGEAAPLQVASSSTSARIPS